MATKFKKSSAVAIVGVATIATAIGINHKFLSEPNEIHRAVTVPLCNYTVQSGDSVEKLFKMQIGENEGSVFYKAPRVPAGQDNIVLNGGTIKNQAVQFFYNIYDTARTINDFTVDPLKPVLVPQLKRGQKLLVPNLDGHGELNGQKCNAGTVTFDATFNRKTLDIKKLIRQNGRITEMK